jgi:hypothetical protein
VGHGSRCLERGARAGERLLGADHAGEAAGQDQLGALADLGGAEVAAAGVAHREGERGLADVVDLEAAVGGVARGGLAALLGADSGHRHPGDAAAGQPLLQRRARHRAVRVLLEAQRRVERGQLCHRLHQAGGMREGAVLLDVENAHDRQLQPGEALDQTVLRREEAGQIVGAEVRPVAERLLDVDDQEGGAAGARAVEIGHGLWPLEICHAQPIAAGGANGRPFPDHLTDRIGPRHLATSPSSGPSSERFSAPWRASDRTCSRAHGRPTGVERQLPRERQWPLWRTV